MADTLEQIERQVHDRLRELEPSVEEYRQLQIVAASLRQKGAAGRPGPVEARGRRAGRSAAAKKSGASRRRRRAPRGQNRERILALIGERPGISNREIADTTGIDRRVVATAVSSYKRAGLVAAEGAGVRLLESPASPS